MEDSEVFLVVVLVATFLVLDGSPSPPSFESIDDDDDVVVLLHLNLVGSSPVRCLFCGFLDVDAAERLILGFRRVYINAARFVYIYIVNVCPWLLCRCAVFSRCFPTTSRHDGES
jgi:hypothetical protein